MVVITRKLAPPVNEFKYFMEDGILCAKHKVTGEILFFTEEWFDDLCHKICIKNLRPSNYNYRVSRVSDYPYSADRINNIVKGQEINPTPEQIRVVTQVYNAKG